MEKNFIALIVIISFDKQNTLLHLQEIYLF